MQYARCNVLPHLTIIIMMSLTASSIACEPQLSPQLANDLHIQLDYQSFTSPTAQWIDVQQPNRIEVFAYTPNLLTVSQHSGGTVPNAQLSSIVSLVENPDFIASCLGKAYLGTGLTSGASFRLQIRKPSQYSTMVCSGLVDLAPATLQAVISKLQATAVSADQRLPVQDAYVRAEPVARARQRELSNAAVKLVGVQTLAQDIQDLLARAITQRWNFVGIDQSQYASLMNLQHNGMLFVELDQKVFQMHLYQSK